MTAPTPPARPSPSTLILLVLTGGALMLAALVLTPAPVLAGLAERLASRSAAVWLVAAVLPPVIALTGYWAGRRDRRRDAEMKTPASVTAATGLSLAPGAPEPPPLDPAETAGHMDRIKEYLAELRQTNARARLEAATLVSTCAKDSPERAKAEEVRRLLDSQRFSLIRLSARILRHSIRLLPMLASRHSDLHTDLASSMGPVEEGKSCQPSLSASSIDWASLLDATYRHRAERN